MTKHHGLIPLEKIMEQLKPSTIAVLEARKSGKSVRSNSRSAGQEDELPTRVRDSFARVDAVVERLRATGQEVTRENYLAMIAPDRNWNDSEIEENLPLEFRSQD